MRTDFMAEYILNNIVCKVAVVFTKEAIYTSMEDHIFKIISEDSLGYIDTR